jgi:hypothetical protein
MLQENLPHLILVAPFWRDPSTCSLRLKREKRQQIFGIDSDIPKGLRYSPRKLLLIIINRGSS